MNRIFWFIVICLLVTIGVAIAMDKDDKDTPPADTPMTRQEFENSVCFTCHQAGQLSAADRTEVQWELLIEKDGHDIFDSIPWQNDLEKQRISDYLRENAKGFMTEGIGVWR